uniref:Uncharacterized protein n=1 Tax=Strigamia maritima TaxID=126957 RepID=T1JMG5_STRMM
MDATKAIFCEHCACAFSEQKNLFVSCTAHLSLVRTFYWHATVSDVTVGIPVVKCIGLTSQLHTMWFLRSDSIQELAPLQRLPVDDADDSEESRIEDSGVQLARSPGTGSLDDESRTSSHDAELAERNSEAAVPTTYFISLENGGNKQRSHSWDSSLQKHTNSSSSSQTTS